MKSTGLIVNEIANIFGRKFPRFYSETSTIAGFLLAITLCTNAFLENKAMEHYIISPNESSVKYNKHY